MDADHKDSLKIRDERQRQHFARTVNQGNKSYYFPALLGCDPAVSDH